MPPQPTTPPEVIGKGEGKGKDKGKDNKQKGKFE